MTTDKLLRSFPQADATPNIFVVNTNNLPADYQATLHRHHYYELAWISNGAGSYFSDFEKYELKEGALIFVAPGQVHTVQAADGKWDAFLSYLIGFRPSLFSQYGSDPNFLASLPFYAPTAVPILNLEEGEVRFFDEMFKKTLARFTQFGEQEEELLFSYLYLLLIEARRVYKSAPEQLEMKTAVHLRADFQRLVEAHYLERMQVNTYAQKLGVTSNHLVKTIRQVAGKTPGQMIRDRLLLEAKRLLIHTNAATKEIAFDLAFKSPAQFSSWFKNLEGKSPTQFRRQFQI